MTDREPAAADDPLRKWQDLGPERHDQLVGDLLKRLRKRYGQGVGAVKVLRSPDGTMVSLNCFVLVGIGPELTRRLRGEGIDFAAAADDMVARDLVEYPAPPWPPPKLDRDAPE